MRKVLYILALALLIGNASAILDLSGTDFDKAFSDPLMSDDGVSKDVGSVTWGTPVGWNDASDGTYRHKGKPHGNLYSLHLHLCRRQSEIGYQWAWVSGAL